VFRLVFDHLTHGRKNPLDRKTPQHIFFVDEILRAIPDALFVEIVRDRGDALAPKKKAAGRRSGRTDSYRPEESPDRVP